MEKKEENLEEKNERTPPPVKPGNVGRKIVRVV